MSKRELRTSSLICAFVLLAPLAAHACPGCASALNKTLGGAFNSSVLFMMAMPFTLFGAFVAGFILFHRHVQKKSARIKTISSQSEPNKEARS